MRTSPYAGLACLLSVLLHATMTNAVLTPMRFGGHGNAIMHALRSSRGALGAKNNTAILSADKSLLVKTHHSVEVENMSSELEHTHSSESNNDRADATTAVPRRGLAEVEVAYVYKETCTGCSVDVDEASPCDAMDVMVGLDMSYGRSSFTVTYGHAISECLFTAGSSIEGQDLNWCSELQKLYETDLIWSWEVASEQYERSSQCTASVEQQPTPVATNDYGEFTVQPVGWWGCDSNDELVWNYQWGVYWTKPPLLALEAFEVDPAGSGSSECRSAGGTEISTYGLSFSKISLNYNFNYTVPTKPLPQIDVPRPNTAAEGTRTERRVAGATAVAVMGALSFVFAAIY